tara:strand:+ start:923 stop:1123 length:201 start_codon:yes stop_codon:yes gene_type:complete
MDYILVVEHLLKRYRERRTDLEEMLSTGGASDWGQYLRIVGEISGLRTAEQEILDLQKNMERAETE